MKRSYLLVIALICHSYALHAQVNGKDKVVTGTLNKVSTGDCYHLIFSCGDFGNAETELEGVANRLWQSLTVNEDTDTYINPAYRGKNFEITYHDVTGQPCGDPSNSGTVIQRVTNFKLVGAPIMVKPAMPTDGLLVWYTFTGNSNDYSGHNNNGKITGAQPAKDRFLKDDAAYYFDRKSFISIGLISQKKLIPPFTVGAWFSSDESYDLQTLVSMGRTPTGTGFNFGYNFPELNGSCYFGAIASAPVGVESPDGLAPSGEEDSWHFALATFDNTMIKLYVDGKIVGIKDVSKNDAAAIKQNLESSLQPIEIGRELTTLDRYFSGYIDDVVIYTKALSEAEANTLYLSLGK